ncbi:hypothetical protein HanPSC8_Chr14g0621201 [Helianthus annuus]|nr:hypothetical protein HanPSC8_Chr14g0621201 [Helianthus annuus]
MVDFVHLVRWAYSDENRLATQFANTIQSLLLLLFLFTYVSSLWISSLKWHRSDVYVPKF